MDGVFVIKGKLQEMYAQHSIVFDKGVQIFGTLKGENHRMTSNTHR